MLELRQTKRTDKDLLVRMENHYSKPKGFVGRSICYAVFYDSIYYGHIVAGSATRFLPNRNEFLGITIKDINMVINNIFFNVSPPNNGRYPIRNFTSSVVKLFVKQSQKDWQVKYGDACIGFETLVEKPRTGDLYLRAGWTLIGETKGYTCKRIAGKGTDGWSGKRVWNTNPDELRPKFVLCYRCSKEKKIVTPAEEIRSISELPSSLLANIFGVSRTTYYKWREGSQPRKKCFDHLVTVLSHIKDAKKSLPSWVIFQNWLRTPVSSNGPTPLEILKEGRFSAFRGLLVRERSAEMGLSTPKASFISKAPMTRKQFLQARMEFPNTRRERSEGDEAL